MDEYITVSRESLEEALKEVLDEYDDPEELVKWAEEEYPWIMGAVDEMIDMEEDNANN